MIALKANKITLFTAVLFTAIFAFVLYRAIALSITFDEASTSFLFDKNYVDIMFSEECFNTANNHILNSLAMKFMMSHFGTKEWAMRLPNVLSFIVYFFSVVVLLNKVCKTNREKIVALILFCSVRYLLDFFSLCRGYGMANAFEMASIASYILFLNKDKNKYLALCFLFASISVYANFTMLNLFFGIVVTHNFLLFYTAKRNIKNILLSNSIPFFFSLLLIIMIRKPLHFIQRNGEMKWGANGWFDSLFTFSKKITYSSGITAYTLEVLLILFGLFCSYIAFSFLKKQKISALNEEEKISLFLIALLLSIIAGTVIQRNVLNVMYLESRKATLYIPILLVLILIVHRYFVAQQLTNRFLFAVTTASVAIFFFSNKNHSFEEWDFNEYSKAASMEINQRTASKNVWLACGNYLDYPFMYYSHYYFSDHFRGIHIPEKWDKTITYSYYYVENKDTIIIPTNYRKIASYENNTSLWERNSLKY